MIFEVDQESLGKLERDLNRIPEALEKAFGSLGQEIRENWRTAALAVDAYDTGRFVHSILEHRLSASEIIVDTSENEEVIYSDIIERGRTDTPNYPGRYPAKMALDLIEARDVVEIHTTAEFDKILNSQ